MRCSSCCLSRQLQLLRRKVLCKEHLVCELLIKTLVIQKGQKQQEDGIMRMLFFVGIHAHSVYGCSTGGHVSILDVHAG